MLRVFPWILSLVLVAGVTWPAHAADVTSIWVGPSGSWTEGGNWSTAPVFPANGTLTYNVAIERAPGGAALDVELFDDLAIDALYLRDATLTTNGTLDVLRGITLENGGGLAGSGSLSLSGNSRFGGASIPLTQLSVINQGDTIWSGQELVMRSGARLINRPQGTFTAAGAAGLATQSVDGIFQNDGLFIHSSAGQTNVASFSHSGMARVQSGALFLQNASGAGDYQVDAGATLDFFIASIAAGARIEGDGHVRLRSTTFRGTLDVDGTTTLYAGAQLGSGAHATGRLIVEAMGANPLRIDGALAVHDEMIWRSGNLLGTGSIQLDGSSLRIDGGGKHIDGMTLSTDGGIHWGAGITFDRGARIVNEVGGSLLLDAGDFQLGAFNGVGGGTLRNEGVMRKLGTGHAIVDVDFENPGSLSVDAGTLSLSGRFTSTGSMSIGSDARLLIHPSTLNAMNTLSDISGPGLLGLGVGRFDLLSSVAPGAIYVSGGDVHFTDPMETLDAYLGIGGGSVSFDGGPIELQDLDLGAGSVWMRDGSRISGTLNWGYGELTGDGQIDLQGTTVISSANLRAVAVRNLASVSHYEGLTLRDGASFINAPGGRHGVPFDASISGDSSTFYRNEGLFVTERFPETDYFGRVNISTRFVNAGVVEVQGMGVDNPTTSTLAFADYAQTPTGTLRLAGGSLEGFSPGDSLRIDAGSFVGTGTIRMNVVSGARLGPGDDGEAGRMRFYYDLDLEAGSLLDLEIGGTERGLEIDAIDVAQIFLDGALSINFIDGYAQHVTADDVFALVTATTGLEGAFQNVASGERLRTADGRGSFAIYYGDESPYDPRSVVATDYVAVPEPALLGLLALAGGAFFVMRAFPVAAKPTTRGRCLRERRQTVPGPASS